MTLIDRLRTGTHEQAVELLRECYKAIFPPRNTLPQGSDERDAAYWRDENFNALLGIGTPEACVGAAMMLIPEGTFYAIITDGDDTSKVSAFCADPKQERPPLKYIHGNTPALALAAAIMETRNV